MILPRFGLYFLTLGFLIIAISFKTVMDVERFSVMERAGTMAVFGTLCLSSFFTARGLARKRRWSWWSAVATYSFSTLIFIFFHFSSIANSPSHPAHQGYVAGAGAGAGAMPFFWFFRLSSG